MNSTVDDVKDTYEESLEGWLASESSFRMAASKVEIAKEAAKFFIGRVMVSCALDVLLASRVQVPLTSTCRSIKRF